MKIIFIDKKKTTVFIVILILMSSMFVFQKIINNSMRMTSLMQSNIKNLKEYKALNGEIEYGLPEDWMTEEKKFEESEIIYHNEFQSMDLKVHGFIQIWDINYNIKEFLENSKAISEKQNKISDYVMENIKINNNLTYSINYTICNNQDKFFRCYEYFLNKDNKIIRFSFFVQEDKFKENMPTIFKNIVSTLKYNKN
ncbi:hypothetical protein K144313037_00790 [Clostridium tetani]|uniref:Conserved membrane-associated protein n=1 Tax=Clostridium tetani (strain Massachusetts / E88) TaxID=212717 RepID=Q899D3_CLOTE|nr:hypothetical protein [Clostridium tetani]AAO34896.1 conserved membrane-associated protein [Clostridium tetani E88]AVP55431.1 hypothetical protein C3B72_09860 [Clostridium tetani]KGI36431.1 hypothetical protein KY52_13800 [Clostridium tetani]KGI37270.1 hypothetical protein LA33_10395 [Clostridium tetani ATCC 9441]KGI44562.1 hypothetical protein KY55_04195 [Clostridium tetani]